MEKMDSIFVDFLRLLPDGIIISNDKGEIVYVNDKTNEMFFYTENELIGERIEVLVPQKKRGEHVHHRTSYMAKPKKMNMSNRNGLYGKRKDDSVFPVEISLAPVEFNDHRNFLAIVKDISNRHYIAELKEKNKELEQFSYIASHDLQEPLRTIMSMANLLDQQRKDSLDELTLKSIHFISRSAKRMSRLVKALLDYSRIGQEHVTETIDTGTLINEIIEDLGVAISEKEAQINLGQLPSVKGIRTELRLLFQNLISNALKFQHPGNKPVIDISATEVDTYHEFKFCDNGIGIAKEDTEKIFNIFQRLHSHDTYKGTGIGLAHCKKIVDAHNGKIHIESTLGQGSTFFINLPK